MRPQPSLTPEETQQLVDEFIHFQINEMTREEMASYVENSMRKEINGNYNANYSLKKEIDEYDEYLYDILLSYIREEENSYEAMQEFIHDREQENNFW